MAAPDYPPREIDNHITKWGRADEPVETPRGTVRFDVWCDGVVIHANQVGKSAYVKRAPDTEGDGEWIAVVRRSRSRMRVI